MKNPPNSLNKDDDEDSTFATMTEVVAAENRALMAQQEAIELRKKLEGLEALLAKTKENLASAQSRIEKKDQEIIKVQLEAHCLGKSVVGLEERFQRLKVLQNVLNEKRKQFGIEFSKTDSNSEASTSDAVNSSTTDSTAINKDEKAEEANSNQDSKVESTDLKKEENVEAVVSNKDIQEEKKSLDTNVSLDTSSLSKQNDSIITETKDIDEDKLKNVENNSKIENDSNTNLDSKCEKLNDSVCCKLEKKCDNQKNEETVKKENETEPSK